MKINGKVVLLVILTIILAALCILCVVWNGKEAAAPGNAATGNTGTQTETAESAEETQIDLSDPNGTEPALFEETLADNTRTYYDINVPAFCDSDGDGTGDLAGVIQKLDYILDLGFNGIALSSVMDSSNQLEVDSRYGTMYDLEDLVYECGQRGIRVMVDFPLTGLDLLSVDVQLEVESVLDFWLGLGVNGFRLSQVNQLVADNEMANLDVLTWFNSYVKMCDPDACVVCAGEIPAEAFDTYYETGVDSLVNDSFAGSAGIITRAVSGELTGAAYAEALAACHLEDAVFFANAETGRAADWFTGENADTQVKMAQAMSILLAGDVFVGGGEEQGLPGAAALWEIGSSDVCAFVKSAIALRRQYPEIALGTATSPEGYSDDQISLVVRRYEDREIILIYNLSATTAQVSLEGLTAQDVPAGELDTLGQLCADGETVSRSGSELTMPAWSILVLGAA